MSNYPEYRYKPRSHTGNCPCRRCTQVRNRPVNPLIWFWPAIMALGGLEWVLRKITPAAWAAIGITLGVLLLATVITVLVKANSPEIRAREKNGK